MVRSACGDCRLQYLTKIPDNSAGHTLYNLFYFWLLDYWIKNKFYNEYRISHFRKSFLMIKHPKITNIFSQFADLFRSQAENQEF